MSDQLPLDAQIAAVRAYAVTVERTAEMLQCPYADAAVFLMKLGSFAVLWSDQDFRAKLDAYRQALAPPATPLTLVPRPVDRSVH